MTKIETLVRNSGYETQEEFVEAYMYDSLVPGICTNPTCDEIYDYEPDQDAGYCECCGTNTVKSGYILIGIM